MNGLDAVKAGALLLVAAPLQVSVVSSFEVAEGQPDLVLVLVVAVALLRGPVFGACGGFWAGLALDVASLGTLGLTSFFLTLAGYWAGRLGQVMSKTSAHTPVLTVALATLGVALASLILKFMLGTPVSPSEFFVPVLLPTLALNLLLAYPVYALCRRLLPTPPRPGREVTAAV